MTSSARSLLAATVVLLGGCAYSLNPRLDRLQGPHGYSYENLAADPRNSEETFVIVTLSGGGTRAAALGYGVISELARQTIGDGRTMLDETDVVSSVSGGSFAAAYLGLFGVQAFLAEFPDAVLHRKLEYGIAARLLLPWNWVRLLSPWFSRSDLASEYYDDAIFHGKTFADMPRRRPFVVLNATDIVEGAQFSFTQRHFERLCSDLDAVHVARGVTASSAFPVAFPPITLSNYPKTGCGWVRPTWVDEQGKDAESNPRAHALARTWESYEQPKRKYVHLSDGGLSDNIGLRAPYDAIDVADDWGMLRLVNGTIRRLVVIVVDAKPRSDSCLDGSARPPGFYSVLNAAATTPMENYSADTVDLMRMLAQKWRQDVVGYERRRAWCAELCRRRHPRTSCDRDCADVLRTGPEYEPRLPAVHVAHVRFDAMDDGPAKTRLQQIDTRLQLRDDDVAVLVRWGRKLLRRSRAYQEAVTELGGTVPPDDD